MRPHRAFLILLGTFFALAVALQVRSSITLLDSLVNGRPLPEFPFDVNPANMEMGGLRPAAGDAGIHDRDVLLAIDGAAVTSRIGYAHALLRHRAGETLLCRIRRNSQGEIEFAFASPRCGPPGRPGRT